MSLFATIAASIMFQYHELSGHSVKGRWAMLWDRVVGGVLGKEGGTNRGGGARARRPPPGAPGGAPWR